ncbi:MAG: molybdopterin-dependent oxidoreductase, partial [Chloroflexi bacterium]|nr:molybdopterin-dependent oxidoreductase [Chloroflexota bacterium]
GGKATEWVPILPGTDGIVCLAMANVLVNELGIYDREYLKKKTNASYLIKEDGRYARDDGGEPLMWDAADGRAKNWKQPVAGPALEGSFEVNGVKCRPVFAALREHLKQYTPERASEISTVPAAIIRRIAAEFGENARIGSTIEIQGFKLPYRPAAAATYMAATAHTNGFHTWFAVDLLNQLVGSAGAVGGASGMAQGRLLGYPGTGFPRYEPVAGKDGFISAEIAPGMTEWPHEKPKLPGSLILAELFPTSPHFSPWPLARDSAELYQKLGIDYQVEAMFGFGGNLAMNTADIEDVAAFLKSVPFLAVSEIYHNETTEGFADIVLPDCHALESMSIMESEYWAYAWPPHLEPNEYRLRQAVVPPMYERRACPDVIIELVDRLGMREEWNKTLNWYFCRFAGCPDLFRPDDRCSWEETVDRLLQQKFGPEHNIEWFKEHGFISWPKRVEETYWRQFADARSHIYLEWLVDQEEETRAICQPRGIELDWAQFTPLISWTPPVPFKEGDHSFDLYTVTFTDPLHCSTWTHGIPWIAEVSDTNPYLYHILLNTMTAKEKGIKDGDEVYVESVRGRRLEGMVHTIEGIHPRCVAMSIGTGKWARGQPLARGKGPCINRIQPLDLEHVCPISLNIESTVKVKVSKKGEGPK